MSNRIIQQERQFAAALYQPLPAVLVQAKGAYVWDEQGNRYLDMMSAQSAVSHGHAHPRLVKTLQTQAETLSLVSRSCYTNKLAPFLKTLCELMGYEQAIPMNTGVEAVETAVKACRKWGYHVKGIPHGRAEIITCTGNFHGRSIAAVAMSTHAHYREGFDPFPAGLVTVPYGDAHALEQAITPNTAAFMVEPIQGERGIIIPPAGYLRACKAICEKHHVLFIADEVQTGLGRTGKLFACQHEDVYPDGLILGKALGGGLLPVSAFLANHDVMQVFHPGDHGSTFGGNPLGCAVATEALNILIEENLIENSAILGEYFLTELKKLQHPAIKEIRGKGLFIGLEIDPQHASAHDICLDWLKRGLLCKETHKTIIRLAPPLIITKTQLDDALAIIQETFA